MQCRSVAAAERGYRGLRRQDKTAGGGGARTRRAVARQHAPPADQKGHLRGVGEQHEGAIRQIRERRLEPGLAAYLRVDAGGVEGAIDRCGGDFRADRVAPGRLEAPSLEAQPATDPVRVPPRAGSAMISPVGVTRFCKRHR